MTNLVKEGTVDSNNHNPQNQSYEKVFSEDGKILVKFFYDEDRDAAKEIKTLIGRNNIILADNTQASAKDPQGIIEGEHLTYAMSINTYRCQQLENLQLDHKEK